MVQAEGQRQRLLVVVRKWDERVVTASHRAAL
jgi:hypothetical protein